MYTVLYSKKFVTHCIFLRFFLQENHFKSEKRVLHFTKAKKKETKSILLDNVSKYFASG